MINGTSYFGGKGSDGTYQRIINRIPKVDLLIETHAGLARVTENIQNKPLIVLNDINPKTVKALYVKFRKYLTEDINAKSGIILENMDAIDLLEKYKSVIEKKETLVFSDPPYPLDSRKNRDKVYEFQYSISQHIELLNYLNELDNYVIVCTYPCELYGEFFGVKKEDYHSDNEMLISEWTLYPYWSQTRRGKALEWMFLNYQKPEQLQDCRFFGENYRDREKWKKIMNNLTRKINDLPGPLRHKLKEEL